MRFGPTQYVLNGAHNIAYAIGGGGDIDLVYTGSGFVPYSMWPDYPPMDSVLDRIGSFARLVVADRRGVGASDPITADAPGTTAQVGDDLAAILMAIDSPGAAVFAEGLAVPAAIEVASARPDLVSHLILFNGFAKALRSDDYPYGMTLEAGQRVIETILDGDDADGDDLQLVFAPSVVDDPVFSDWSRRGGQLGASRRSAETLYGAVPDIDVRHLLGNIVAPTLILHRRDARMWGVEHSEYLAEAIEGSKLVVLDGADQPPYVGDTSGWLNELERFVVGRSSGEGTRCLTTMLFTDIVGSTELAATVGDRRWRELLDLHDRTTARAIRAHGGRRITATGDGALMTFETPTSAVAAAAEILATLDSLGLRMRAGIHTGEVELRGDDIGGIAVNLTARVLDLAGAGEIMVSGALPAITIGSAISYEARGVHELRGVPGRWPVLLARLD